MTQEPKKGWEKEFDEKFYKGVSKEYMADFQRITGETMKIPADLESIKSFISNLLEAERKKYRKDNQEVWERMEATRERKRILREGMERLEGMHLIRNIRATNVDDAYDQAIEDAISAMLK